MTYAYDLWAQMPVRDLYDTLMMAMAINAAKDMYEKGQLELKDFKKEYGDFSSPFVKDMQAYGKMMKGVRDIVDTAYANGIDLARSPEGRMIIQKAINSIDPAVYNEMKENAKWGTLYKQAEMELKSKDKFSQDAEDFYRRSQGLPSFEEFSTIGDKGEHNQWRSTSPIAFQTLAEATNGWYDKRTPYLLTAELAKRELGSDYDPRKTYTGFLDEDLMNIAGQNTPGWQGSFWSEYYRDLAARQIAARGETPTADAVEKQLLRNVADANQKWLVNPTGSLDDWYKTQSIYNSRRSDKEKDNVKTSYGLSLFARGLYGTGLLGDPVKAQKDAYNFGRQVSKDLATKLTPGQKKLFGNFALTKAFVDRYTQHNMESLEALNHRFPGNVKDGLLWVDEGLVPFIKDINEVTTNTLGYPSKNVAKTNNKKLEEFLNATHTVKDKNGNETEEKYGVRMITTTDGYTAPTKDHTYELYIFVRLIRDDGKELNRALKIYETDPAQTVRDEDGDMIATNGYNMMPSQRSTNWWSAMDNNLNSQAGLASETIRRGLGEILDTNLLNPQKF